MSFKKRDGQIIYFFPICRIYRYYINYYIFVYLLTKILKNSAVRLLRSYPLLSVTFFKADTKIDNVTRDKQSKGIRKGRLF